jgi:hypothetical protein
LRKVEVLDQGAAPSGVAEGPTFLLRNEIMCGVERGRVREREPEWWGERERTLRCLFL